MSLAAANGIGRARVAEVLEQVGLAAVARNRVGGFGASLRLAESTVKSHVQSILAKLGVRDRLQAAVAPYESGLVRPGDGGRQAG